MTGVWACDHCDTNNPPGSTFCRRCKWQPENAQATRRVTSVISLPTALDDTPPVFTESRYLATERASREPVPLITLAPTGHLTRPPTARPLPRPPAPPPPAHSVSTAKYWWLGGLILAAIIVLIYAAGSGSVGNGATPGEAVPQAPTAAPCPSEAARWLPGGGADATLLARYTTPKHVVTVCRLASGQIYYDGQVSGASVNSDTHISLLAQESPGGFTARNGAYTYQITGNEVIVTKNGAVLNRWPLTPA